MKTIWKFLIEITDYQELDVPQYAIPRHVGLDPLGAPCIWFAVDTDYSFKRRAVRIVGTGNPAEAAWGYAYIASFLMGDFVWHVFDCGEVGAGEPATDEAAQVEDAVSGRR